jgi:hypothetical protein
VGVLVVAGCGGPSREEQFAEAVCAASVPHAQQLLEIYNDVKLTRAAPGGESRSKQLRFTLAALNVVERLGTDLDAVEVPETDAADKAIDYFENFVRLAAARIATEQRRIEALPEEITLVQSIRSLDSLELGVIDAFGIVVGAPRTVAAQVPELEDALTDAEECTELAALATS